MSIEYNDFIELQAQILVRLFDEVWAPGLAHAAVRVNSLRDLVDATPRINYNDLVNFLLGGHPTTKGFRDKIATRGVAKKLSKALSVELPLVQQLFAAAKARQLQLLTQPRSKWEH